MDKYIFPAVFDPCEEGGYTIIYPDLPGCITEGDNIEEALHMAKDALELHLYGMELGEDIKDLTDIGYSGEGLKVKILERKEDLKNPGFALGEMPNRE